MISIELTTSDEGYSVDSHQDVVRTSETIVAERDESSRSSVSTNTVSFISITQNIHFWYYIGTGIFIIASMVIGILTVCLTAPKPNDVCQRTYIRTVTGIDYNSHPQSVAIGYINNDTQWDFVVTNTGTDTIDIFLGYDNETFEQYMTISTGINSYPYSVALANFNNETGIDIAVANFGTNRIGIFFGLNNGNFTFYQSFSTGSSHPLFITVADFNHDHQSDIIVLNYGTNSISIFFGNGDGSFVLSMTYVTGYDSLPNSLAVADLNNDNYLDIVVANYGTNNIGIFYGIENDRFEDQVIYSTGLRSNPSSIVIVDINNDKTLDIIVANNGTNNIGIFYGYENESFSKQITYSTGVNSHPIFISIGDFNIDNQLDIIAVDSINEKVYVLPQDKNGSFSLISMYGTGFGSSPVSVSVSDFNNDTGADALIVNRGTNNVLSLMEYNFNLSESYSTFTAEIFSNPLWIATGDLNNDSFLDIVVTDESYDQVIVLLGYGNGSFSFFSTFPVVNGSAPGSVVLSDFNNDHQLDIAVIIPYSNTLGILLGYGNGMFSTAVTYSTGITSSPSALSVGDINNDKCLDIVIVSEEANSIEIFIGYCNGTFVLARTYTTPSGWGPSLIIIDDYNSDNKLDLAIAYSNNNAFTIYFGTGIGSFLTTLTYTIPNPFSFNFISSGDFNNDNQSDIAGSMLETNTFYIFFGTGNGTFPKQTQYSINSCLGLISLIAGDFNSDGQSDIAVTCCFSNNIVILFGNSYANFSTQVTYSTGQNSYPSHLVIGDFDNNKQVDIAVANYLGSNVGIFLSYYYADFAIQTLYSTGSGSHPYSVATADFNHDNILDIVVANSGTDNIGIQLGFGNGSFQIETTYSTGYNSFPQYVTVGDFNRDNHPDVAIALSKSDSIMIYFGNGNGSFGNSVTYPMNIQSSPTSIAIADFNNDGWLDLVVTNEGTNELGILYGYNYATYELDQTYSTGNLSFPQAVSVGDLNNDNKLDIALVDTLSSNVGIFFGYRNGSFTSQITYSTGVKSYPNLIALADLNNDDCLDIVIANNGTNCIGILLGYGNGSFQSIMTYPISNDSEPTAIVIADVNNDHHLDVIVADKSAKIVGVFPGFGNGSVSSIIRYSNGPNFQPNSIALGDLNNDTYLDIVVMNGGTGQIDILQGYGNGSFVLIMTYVLEQGSNSFSIVLGDFNNDNKLDIAVSNFDFGYIGIFLGFGNGSFASQKTYSTGISSFPSYMIVDFFNDDDYVDIAVICMGNSAFVVLFGTGDGRFLIGRTYLTSTKSYSKMLAAGDFNNDSRLDIVITNTLDYNINIFYGNGKEFFGLPITGPTGLNSKPYSVAVGDFNNDSQSDIVFVDYGTNNMCISLEDENENFQDFVEYSTGTGSQPHAVVVGDFNNDNWLDIAVVNSGTNNVLIFQGYGNGSFVETQLYSTGIGSVPYAIAVSDFNNDKKMDLAIVNSGTNDLILLFGFGNGTFGNKTSYVMDYNSNPYSVAVGDFNNDTWIDIAVANNGEDYVEIFLQTCLYS